MKPIYILGHSNVTLGILFDILYAQHGDQVIAEVINNIPEEQNSKIEVDYLHKCIATKEFFHTDFKNYDTAQFLLGAMTVKTKKAIVDFFAKHYQIKTQQYNTISHPSAIISSESIINPGSQINPGVIVAQHSNIGNFVTLNRAVTIGHHTKIRDFTTINPGCNIAGFCSIGRGVTIGMGTNIFDEIKIGDNSIIGAGSLVTKDVPENTLVYGVPAKIISKI